MQVEFRTLYEQHVAFVFRTLRRLGVAEPELADATQETFLLLYQNLPQFEWRAKLTTWLFRTALNVARSHRRKGRLETACGDEVSAFLDESADVAEEVKMRQGRALLQQMLDALPEDQRTSFVLFELEGLGAETVSEMLEVPLGTVYSRVRLARQAIAHKLARLQARTCVGRLAPAGGTER